MHKKSLKDDADLYDLTDAISWKDVIYRVNYWYRENKIK